MKPQKKLNFWQLCWTRYAKDYDSFFDMFSAMTLELHIRKSINWIAAKTIIQTAAILTMIGIVVFALHWLYPSNSVLVVLLIWGPIIALVMISVVLYLGYHISKGFAQYVEHHTRFTSGGGYYDGLEISDILDEVNPTKKIWQWWKKLLQ